MKRRLALFAFSTIALLALVAALNFFDEFTLEQMPVRFVTVAMLGGVAFFAAVSRFPVEGSIRAQTWIFWSVALLLRISLFPLEPGDDLWRYQWEGKIQQAGFNPYVHAPDDPALDAMRDEFEPWNQINHRSVRAIYPPGAQLIFAGMSRVSLAPLFYKLVFAAADLGVAAILLLLVGGASRFGVAAWYAWNPLVIHSFAGAAHFDSLMILPMLAGVLMIARSVQTDDVERRWILSGAAAGFLGVAVSIKLIPLLLLPAAAIALRRRGVLLSVSLAIPALLSLWYGYPRIPIWESLGDFAHVTRLNDLFWWIVEGTVWPNPRQKNFSYNVVIVIAVVLVSLLFWKNWRRGMFWALGTALILSPVLHPWYCTWILPFAAWRQSRPWIVLSVTLFAYYLFWNERLFLIPWRTEAWLRMIIIVPPLLAWMMPAMRRVFPARREGSTELSG